MKINSLLKIMQHLRDPETGCPWDVEQTFTSIAPYTIEEAYEVNHAIASQDHENLKEELGDLLLQVVFHSQIASEKGLFSFDDVVAGICDKMVRRHPHVFEEQVKKTADQQLQDWQAQKAKEKPEPTTISEKMADKTKGLPPTLAAEKIMSQSDQIGFVFDHIQNAFNKLQEEIGELQNAPSDEQLGEYGDCLFILIRIGKMLGLSADQALAKTNQKFIKRFNAMEQATDKQLENLSSEEWVSLWKEAKKVA